MSAAVPPLGVWTSAGRRRPNLCRPTPTVLQMEAVECGAAALAMVLAHHGRWVPLEELRVACGVSRDGSNAFNILKAARAYGLAAKAFRKEPAGLLDLPVPSILHWNFNHYVVFEGLRNGRAQLNDPAGGRRSVSPDELDAAFTGVVLAFQPADGFRTGGTPPRPWRQLADALGRSRASVLLVALFSLFLVVPGIVVPGLSKLFIDTVLVQRFEEWLVPLCLCLAGAGLLQMLVVHLQQTYLLRLEAKLSVVLASRLLARLLALPMAFFSQRQGGELVDRVAAADRIGTLLSGQVATALFNLFAVVAYGAAMAAFDPLLAALAVAVPAANLTLLAALRRRMGDLGRRIATDHGRLLGATASTIVGLETIKLMGGEDEAFAAWSGHQARSMDGLRRLGLTSGLLAALPELLTALGTAAVLAVGGLRVIDGALTVGALVAVQGLMASFIGPFNGLVALSDRIQAARADLARIGDVLDAAPERRPAAAAAASFPGVPEGRIEARGLTFGYSRTGPPLIEDVSLVLEPGMRVAIVGGSGSGKSTVGRLLCGLLEPWAGEVRIDGRLLEDIPPHVFAAAAAYVDQEVFLFEGSVRDNLTLWNPSVPEASITRALKDAEIHADVAARPGGCDAAVAEGGANFSGGQRQRLEIARALAGEPAILVLDEATAALDPQTEQRIDENLRRRGCTCVIIAHRLSTIRDCDEILVLRQGRIVERGTHDTLLRAGGAYADLIGAGA